MYGLPQLNEVAADLTRSMVARDRYARLAEVLTRALPCDAAAILRLEGDQLRPLAVHGLVPEVLGRRFELDAHPRLAAICAASGPHLFPGDSELPDPFDGLVAGEAPHLAQVHSCLGVPLRVDNELVGVLTADALAPEAFAHIDTDYLRCLGTLAAAVLRTSLLLEVAESDANDRGSLAVRLLNKDRGALPEMLGSSAALDRIRSEVELVAGTELSVLISGATGVGKEHVAASVHRTSARREAPLVHVNCAALPASLAESELFGHERGAFTGADKARRGRFLEADGGTLFLDEIGELPLELQPKLLRALQEGEVQAIGSDRPTRVNVRIVAATNRDLVREIDARRFRSDLYHRLCQFPIHVPPLRERPEDVPVLAALFAERAMRQLGTGPVRLTPSAHAELARYTWPGNVRELQNVIARAVLKSSGPRSERVLLEGAAITAELDGAAQGAPHSAAPVDPSAASDPRPLVDRVLEFKRSQIAAALERSAGNLAAAARELGVERSNLHATVKRLGLPVPGRA